MRIIPVAPRSRSSQWYYPTTSTLARSLALSHRLPSSQTLAYIIARLHLAFFETHTLLHYQLRLRGLKNSPLSIMSSYSVMYIYSSLSLYFSPPYSLVVFRTLTKVKAVLAESSCLWFTTNQRSTVYVNVNITNKNYMEELSMSSSLKKQNWSTVIYTRNAHSIDSWKARHESWPVDIFVFKRKHDFREMFTLWQHTLNM